MIEYRKYGKCFFAAKQGILFAKNVHCQLLHTATSQSPILNTTITLKRLAKRGYLSMLDYYLKVSPQFNEPLYTWPVRTVVREALPAGDAGGAAYSIMGWFT